MKSRRFILPALLSIMFMYGCTKLNGTAGGNLTRGQVANDSSSATTLLQGVYASLKLPFTSFMQIFPLSDTTTDEAIVDERGRELWWENWRRQDLIRFGKFLLPFREKNYVSDPKYLLFPIPYEQIAVNPNLAQNPGY
jgi:hypothetical protein